MKRHVLSRLLALTLICTLLLGAGILPTAQAATTSSYATAVVKGGWLRLRAQPSMNSATISAYYTGTVVTILGGSGSWYYVSAPDGNVGYMSSSYLTVTGSITGGQVSANIAAFVTSGNGKPVRMRTGPSTAYDVIASYAVGTPATILISGTDWCKVRINGRTGYMMTEFLTTSALSTTPPSQAGYTAYVTSANGKPVRLRSYASKSAGVLGTYNVGTKLTVLSYGVTWCKVRTSSQVGYMMTEFITTSAPSVVVSVSLDKTSVWPGETLYASVQPSNANVTYEWLNDRGTLVGRGSAYTVSTTDAGRKLRVRATGKSGTSGSALSGWSTVQGNGHISMAYVLQGAGINITSPTVGQTLNAVLYPSGATANVTWYRDDNVYLGTGYSYTVKASDAGHSLYIWAEGTGATTGSVVSAYTSTVAGVVTPITPTPVPAPSLRISGVTLSDLTPTVGQALVASVEPAGATAVITWYRDDDVVLGIGSTYLVKANDAGHTLYVWADGSGATSGSATSRVTAPVAEASSGYPSGGVELITPIVP